MRLFQRLFIVLVFSIASLSLVFAQMQVERLSRGLVAVKQANGYYLSWRLLGTEPWETGFNVYRGETKLNEAPITNVTSYFDEGASLNSTYYVRPIINGVEMPDARPARLINTMEGSNAGYFDIPINRPATGAQGGTYSQGDASTGDLTGDGEYEIVLKWDPSNAKDNSHSGNTDNVLLDAYTLDGVHLWRIDLGPNIRAGAHYTQFLVYDFDGDGRAELMVKTAPGTKDASGNFISKGPAGTTNHNSIYRNSNGYILSGPEYLTVFDGKTGLELATADYWPLRGTVSSWGDNYGNRLDRYNATVAYVDGERPTGVFQRGYYTRMTFAAWDWRNGKLTRKWTFDSNTSGNSTYAGQGNHSIHVIDANGDGKQDIVTGSAVVSGDGKGMHTTRMGHGDATHVSYMKKGETRPMIFMPHESGGHGVSLRYADNGEMIFNHKASGDIGRGCAAELDPNRPGFHYWASGGLGLYNINGNKVGNNPNSINFVIWWDGNLSRELMNGNAVDRWNIASNSSTRLLTGNNASSINGSKSTPVLQADLFGDWREEVILRRTDNRALRVYTSVMPTTHKLYTFMHDPVYRVAVSWQNSSYNQPPHPGYYVASDMDFPPPVPNVSMVSGFNRGSGEVFKNLRVYDDYNVLGWTIESNMRNSTKAYADKVYYMNSVPDHISGAEWIRPAFNSNYYAHSNELASFIAAQTAAIYVLYPAIADAPQWLSTYTKSNETIRLSIIGQTPIELAIYEKQVAAGDNVSLGISSPDAMMYLVAAKANGVSADQVSQNKGTSFSIYPNPLNDVATIEYRLDSDQRVTVDVYNVSGRRVKNIMNEWKGAGTHSTLFNASSIPAGVYLIRLLAGNHAMQQKIIITR